MKNHKLLLFTCSLSLFVFYAAHSQQGSVAAGGDATGPGGSMSFSIGQTDYLTYSSAHGSVSLGIQQSWYSVPQVLEIPDMILTAGPPVCFDATETVIMAGNGKHFIVESGAHADIIAGQNILMREGVSVEAGGSLHAYISTVWCSYQPGMLTADFAEPPMIHKNGSPERESSFFRIYPNPTTGDFTLELLEFKGNSELHVELYNAQGNLILTKQLPVERLYTFTLYGMQPGMYLVRVYKSNEAGTGKLIKQ